MLTVSVFCACACVCLSQEFAVRIKEGPERSGVQVPPLLEKMRGDGTLHCMFLARETMLDTLQVGLRRTPSSWLLLTTSVAVKDP